MKNRVLALSVAAALVACGHGAPQSEPAALHIATADMVWACRLLGDVHGVSSLYGVFAAKALAKGRVAAMNQARKLGADTIVWIGFNTPHGSTSVDGLAYDCP